MDLTILLVLIGLAGAVGWLIANRGDKADATAGSELVEQDLKRLADKAANHEKNVIDFINRTKSKRDPKRPPRN